MVVQPFLYREGLAVLLPFFFQSFIFFPEEAVLFSRKKEKN